MLKIDSKIVLDRETILSPNLCDRFSAEDLTRIGRAVYEGYRADLWSRRQWEKRNEAGMDLALQLQKPKNFPWPSCSNVAFPLVTIAAMQFHARAYPAIINGTDVAKCRVIGQDPEGSAKARADRISAHMSWQVLEEDHAWEEQHDRGLLNLSIVGCNFIKTYHDNALGYDVSELVAAKDLVVDYWAKSIEAAPRKTQIIPLFRNDIYERVKRGTFRDVLNEAWYTTLPQQPQRRETDVRKDQRQGVVPPQPDETTPFSGLEQHVLMDLDQDGYAEPYIITIEEHAQYVLRIVTGFDREEDIEWNADDEIIAIRRMEYYTKYSFIPSPDGGIYDIGFGVLLGPLNESVNTAINQLFDAGTWSTTAGGFLGRGAKIRGGDYYSKPLEWKRVDSTGDDLRKNVVPHAVREPSAVLFNLLSLLINYTNRVSGANDMMVGENPGQNTPAQTSQTMLQEGMRIYSAIFKRVWRAMKEELKKRYVLNAIYLPVMGFSFGPTGNQIRPEDYRGSPNEIAPAADPNISSPAQKLQQAMAVKASAATTPGYDVAETERFYLRALGVEAIDQIYPGPDKVPAGKDVKLQIAEMKEETARMKLQAEQSVNAAEMMMEGRRLDAEIARIQAEIALKSAEIEGDVQDREVGRLNAMVSILKSQSEQVYAKVDALMRAVELRQNERKLDIEEKKAQKQGASNGD